MSFPLAPMARTVIHVFGAILDGTVWPRSAGQTVHREDLVGLVEGPGLDPKHVSRTLSTQYGLMTVAKSNWTGGRAPISNDPPKGIT